MIKQLRIINDDKGWKGTWYRSGSHYYVKPDKRTWVLEQWSAVDVCGGISAEDAVVVTGALSFVKCRLVEFQILLGFRLCMADISQRSRCRWKE